MGRYEFIESRDPFDAADCAGFAELVEGVDERGAGNWIDGPRRGGPKDFVAAAAASDAVLVIPTK